MREITVHLQTIMEPGKRFDPPFYLGSHQLRQIFRGDDTRIVQLGDLLSEIEDGARLPVSGSGVPILRLSNLHPCEISMEPVRFVAPGKNVKWPILKPGDVLFTQAAEPFRAAVVPAGISFPATVSSEIAILRPRPAVLPEYLAAVLSTKKMGLFLRDLAYRRSAGALRRLILKDIALIPIPLPNRSIQEEIRNAYIEAADMSQKAYSELKQIVKAVQAEINLKIGSFKDTAVMDIRRSKLTPRWDVSYVMQTRLRDSLLETGFAKPLIDLAKPLISTLRGIDENETVLAVRADSINESTFMVEEAEMVPFKELSPRMRQPLHPHDVLLCTTGSGQQVAFIDEAVSQTHVPILGSATFTALRFSETPCFFTIALTHPIVRKQLDFLASGTVQRFVSKKDLDALLLPYLSQVWREDFDARIQHAFERRRDALVARAKTLTLAEQFFKEVLK